MTDLLFDIRNDTKGDRRTTLEGDRRGPPSKLKMKLKMKLD